MARNRVIYQSEALYVSRNILSSTSGQHVQLDRVQSANYSFTVNRQDINQFGELGRIGYVALEPPTVNLDFTYYLTDGSNERALNFHVRNTSVNTERTFLSGHMISEFSGQNFYILTSPEGSDVNNTTGDSAATGGYIKNAIGIGNAYVTNYSLDASVGALPTVSVSFEGANINAVTGVSATAGGWAGLQLASVNPESGTALSATAVVLSSGKSSISSTNIPALRPGDITLNLNTFHSATDSNGIFVKVSGTDAIHVQSAALSIPLSRTPVQRLGSRFAFTRPLDLPASATLSVSAIVNEMTAENLATLLDLTVEKNISLTIKNPVVAAPAVVYTLKKCRLDSESYSSSIGGNKTIDMVFSTQYASLNDTTRGVFMSGICPGLIFGTGANGFLLSTTGSGGAPSGAAVFSA
jgi:hypothetical protein